MRSRLLKLVRLSVPSIVLIFSLCLIGQAQSRTVVVQQYERQVIDLNAPQAVTQAQMILRDRGYYHHRITGVMDDNTRNSLKRFQDDHGLKKTGYLDAGTVEILGVGPV